MSSNTFDGKIVLVTGSNSGIGAGIVTQFAKRGAKVIVTGRDNARVASVVEQCDKESPNHQKALGIKCDFSKDDEIHELVNKTIKTFGGLDILVSNAGVGTFDEITKKDVMSIFDMTFNTNLRAPFLLIHLLVPHLIKSKGNIINISSIGGLHPVSNGSIPCGSKAALDMMTKCLAIDLGPKGVRVNSVSPAVTRTPVWERMGVDNAKFELMENKCKADYPLGRIGEVKDITNMVLFLASEDASFITGMIAPVDGGSLLTFGSSVH